MSEITFEDLIQRCNFVLWECLYDGVSLEFKSHQHRDLIRTFMAGAVEAMIAMQMRNAVAGLLEEYARMADPNWWPDERFNRSKP